MGSRQIVPPDPVPGPVDVAADALAAALVTAAWFLAVAAFVYLLGGALLVPAAVRVVRARNPNNPTVVDATGTYLRVLLVVVATLVGVVAAGYGSVLSDSAVVVAAATLALGIAGQELIGSLVSGLSLVADPEFNVGDWIEWPDGEGRVERVGFRATRVRTAGNEIVTVPNSSLATGTITRPYRRDRVRVSDAVVLAHGEDLDVALRTLAAAAGSVEGVLDSPVPEAGVAELGDGGGVRLAVAYWIEDPTVDDVADVRSAVRERAIVALEAEGVELGPAARRELDGRLTVDREE
ncbi:mechanosensitive ion channel family protein [Halorarum halobium]|uniref:mechanosensitive ion channel family protein n=1 Tax=Halorarum halobium TaxID=3075121 RepID=UPI0028AB088D|nr:mechanosensitive ion channel family protein [Halobaculum sp. XH14]